VPLYDGSSKNASDLPQLRGPAPPRAQSPIRVGRPSSRTNKRSERIEPPPLPIQLSEARIEKFRADQQGEGNDRALLHDMETRFEN